MSDELSPRLAALIAAEREAPTGDRERVRAKLGATLGLAAATSAAAAATSSIAGKLVVLALTVGAIGGGTAIALHERGSHESAPEPRVALATSASRAPIAPPVPHATIEVPVPRAAPVALARAVDRHVAPTTAAPAPLMPDPTPAAMPVAEAAVLPDQRTLLASAWAASAANDLTYALALVDRDATLHADGELAEEREALRIDLLRRAGRTIEANAAARAFLAQFPASIHRALVAHALIKEPP